MRARKRPPPYLTWRSNSWLVFPPRGGTATALGIARVSFAPRNALASAGLEQSFVLMATTNLVHHALELRRIAHLVHLAAEAPLRMGIDGKAYVLSVGDIADIRLVDVGMHFHLGQIVSDGK